MSDDLSFLQTQLDSARQNLQLIQERKAAYVMEEEVPLQLIKNERSLAGRIKQLENQIASVKGSTQQKASVTLGDAESTTSSATQQQTQQPDPLAFMSYSRDDDEYLNQALTSLREYLSRAIKFVTGKDFPIFQDTKDIIWGQNWKDRLEKTLDAATFLIPILTPNFFHSEYCRMEVERFARREQQLGRNDLILPIYYMDYSPLDRRDTSDPIVQVIVQHHYVDWRQFRHKPFDSEEVRAKLEDMARDINRALSTRS